MDHHNGPAGTSEKDLGSAAQLEAWWVGQPAELPAWAAAKPSRVVDPDGWWVDHPALTPLAVPAAIPAPAARCPRYGRLAAALLLLLALGLVAGVIGWHLGKGETRPEESGGVEPAAPEQPAEAAEPTAAVSLLPCAIPERAEVAGALPAPRTGPERRAVVGPRLAPEELLAVAPQPRRRPLPRHPPRRPAARRTCSRNRPACRRSA